MSELSSSEGLARGEVRRVEQGDGVGDGGTPDGGHCQSREDGRGVRKGGRICRASRRGFKLRNEQEKFDETTRPIAEVDLWGVRFA